MDIPCSPLSRAIRGQFYLISQEHSLQDVGFGSYCFIFGQGGDFPGWHRFVDKARRVKLSAWPSSEGWLHGKVPGQ